MRRLVKRSLAVLLPSVGLTGAVLLASSPPSKAADPPAPLSAGFLDVARGSYLRVQLDQAADNYGAFTVSIPGVGLAWPASPAAVKVERPHAIRLSYDGAGSKDPEAHLDAEFGVGLQAGGPAQQVELRLIGHIDPAHHTASVEVWVDGKHYHIGATATPTTAGPVVAAYLAAVRTGDWASLYAIADSSLRSGMTQDEFSKAMAGSDGASGISDATATGPTTYTTNEAGISYARTPIRLTYGTGTSATKQDGTLVLILEAGNWKVFTVE
jgi:hypothetical protein